MLNNSIQGSKQNIVQDGGRIVNEISKEIF
jgi:hypothetical protein